MRSEYGANPTQSCRAGFDGERVPSIGWELESGSDGGQPLLLRRDQIGTVVMTYDGTAFDVEFSGRDGRAYALVPISAGRLKRLREAPEYAAT